MNLLVVVLSNFIGAGSCGWSISITARLITVASWSLSKAVAISHSKAEATILFRILHSVWTDPFNFGWTLSTSLIKSLRK